MCLAATVPKQGLSWQVAAFDTPPGPSAPTSPSRTCPPGGSTSSGQWLAQSSLCQPDDDEQRVNQTRLNNEGSRSDGD